MTMVKFYACAAELQEGVRRMRPLCDAGEPSGRARLVRTFHGSSLFDGDNGGRR